MKVSIVKKPCAGSLYLLTVTDDEGRLVLSKEFMNSLENPHWCEGGVRFFEDLTNPQKVKKIEEVITAIDEAGIFPNDNWVDGIEYQSYFIVHKIVDEIHTEESYSLGDLIDLDEALIKENVI